MVVGLHTSVHSSRNLPRALRAGGCNLRRLDLSSNELHAEGLAELLNAFLAGACASLEDLGLASNGLGEHKWVLPLSICWHIAHSQLLVMSLYCIVFTPPRSQACRARWSWAARSSKDSAPSSSASTWRATASAPSASR